MSKSKEEVSEELDLFREYRRTGDIEIRNKLIEDNVKYTTYISKTYMGKYQIDKSDLVSIATLGLMKAVDTYDPDRNITFGTYAFYCIRNELNMEIRKERKRRGYVMIPLEDSFVVKKEGDLYSIADSIPSKDNVEEDGIARVTVEELTALMDKVLNKKEKFVMIRRFLGEDILPQKEVAEELGVSRCYVSKLESSAEKKLRECLELSVLEKEDILKK